MEPLETICATPEECFELGTQIAGSLSGGEVLLLYGGLGAGKTLLAKGILAGFGYDVDEVTSPSFTLVNLYKTDRFDVYHIDLWRLDGRSDAAGAVGLDEILDEVQAVTIIEWADRLTAAAVPVNAIKIFIDGDGGEPRKIKIEV